MRTLERNKNGDKESAPRRKAKSAVEKPYVIERRSFGRTRDFGCNWWGKWRRHARYATERAALTALLMLNSKQPRSDVFEWEYRLKTP